MVLNVYMISVLLAMVFEKTLGTGTHVGNASILLAARCATNTQQSCRLFDCASSYGPTQCNEDSYCICSHGYCLTVAGVCTKKEDIPACQNDTGGTCRFASCDAWRGDTSCVDGKCICKEGFCALDTGECVREGHGSRICQRSTGSSCVKFCSPYYQVSCDWGSSLSDGGKCMCDEGTCYFSGFCLSAWKIGYIREFWWPMLYLLAFALFFWCICIPILGSAFIACQAVTWIYRKCCRRTRRELKAPLL